jgi:UDP-N-acetylmuramate dehydrogenase
MRLGGTADYFCSVESEDDVVEAVTFANSKDIPFKIVGSGSNLIWADSGFAGLIIENAIQNFTIDDTIVHVGAGVEWDECVAKTVDNNLSGLEFLSFIPGLTGATPVQNVGAYGREIKDVLLSLRAYDTENNQFIEIKNEDCDFAYRKSRFNTSDKNRFIITEVTFQLSNQPPTPPFYESLQRYLDDKGITEYTPAVIREAVIAIRSSKLPDPDFVANNGSFFANPIISMSEYEQLVRSFPGIVAWPHADKMKISAAWLIEQAGFKDFHDEVTGMATWATQPLVLINEHAQSTDDVLLFRDKIQRAVADKFGITLEQEPELVA